MGSNSRTSRTYHNHNEYKSKKWLFGDKYGIYYDSKRKLVLSVLSKIFSLNYHSFDTMRSDFKPQQPGKSQCSAKIPLLHKLTLAKKY